MTINRTFVPFGELQIPEHIFSTLLRAEERLFYVEGFALLQKMFSVADSYEKLVLLKPPIMSVLVGIQAFTDLGLRGELRVIQILCQKADICLDDHFICFLHTTSSDKRPSESVLRESSFFELPDRSLLDIEYLDYYQRVIFVNIHAMRMVLTRYHKQLHVSRQMDLSRQQLIQYFTLCINGDRVPFRDRSLGLFSNFPISDIERFIRTSRKDGYYARNYRSNDNDYHLLSPHDFFGQHFQYEPLLFLDPTYYLYRYFFSRTSVYYPRLKVSKKVVSLQAEGLGIVWCSYLPTGLDVVSHCQKLREIDRELGLTLFLEEQLRTLHSRIIIDNIRRFRSSFTSHFT